MANRSIDPQLAGPQVWHDPSRGYNMINVNHPYIPSGNPEDERSGLDKIRESNLATEPMLRRDKLRAQAIAEAAKVGKGYRDFETPNQPDEFGVPLTDGFGYC